MRGKLHNSIHVNPIDHGLQDDIFFMTSFQQYKTDQERKRFLMWLWVAVITAAIVIGWVFTFRAAARRVLQAQQTTGNQQQPALDDFQKQWQESMEDFKKTWEATKNI